MHSGCVAIQWRHLHERAVSVRRREVQRRLAVPGRRVEVEPPLRRGELLHGRHRGRSVAAQLVGVRVRGRGRGRVRVRVRVRGRVRVRARVKVRVAAQLVRARVRARARVRVRVRVRVGVRVAAQLHGRGAHA
jgi:hypothetical protein